MKRTIGLSLSISLLTIASWAQTQSNNNQISNSNSQSHFEKQFKFDRESDTKEIFIPVETGTKFLNFNFKGDIDAGILWISILDPKGKKEGGFTLEALDKKSSSSNSNTNSNSNNGNKTHTYTIVQSKKGSASGNMSKTIDNPSFGKWQVRIVTKNLEGVLKVMIAQQREQD